ncbi:hypothetical protein [Sneathiella litorea]|uniref:Uncharacterized protein n=1 Tax=Sneathiella litorea TaxID=2606216 RepID=A0A6L8WAM3_9PROT|nr:hypothetical protein [Sneathiella litorea]MZR32091.1 hypothetical protein [Sneathiella litorea]
MIDLLHTILKFTHIGSLALGVGGAIISDLFVLGILNKAITKGDLRLLENLEKIIFLGLMMLWISGVGFFVEYQLFSPEKLGNPKIMAKLTIVMIVTLNGLLFHMFFHNRVFREGMVIIKLPVVTYYSLILFGTLSCFSWIGAMTLGAVSQLNYTFPYLHIMAGYLAIVAFGMACGCAFASFKRWNARRKPEFLRGDVTETLFQKPA